MKIGSKRNINKAEVYHQKSTNSCHNISLTDHSIKSQEKLLQDTKTTSPTGN